MYQSYWLVLDRSISWMDSLDLRISNCKSCQQLDMLEKECALFTDILGHILSHSPFLFCVFYRKDLKRVRGYFDDRLKTLTTLFNKRRIYLHVKDNIKK